MKFDMLNMNKQSDSFYINECMGNPALLNIFVENITHIFMCK